jgi:hypothetical protein
MKRPVSMKRARSTPVSMPMPPSRPHPRSRRCRSPGRTGATAATMMETPSPRQARMLASAWPRGVAEVHGDAPEPDPVSGRFDHPAGGERRPYPDGVAERDLSRTQARAVARRVRPPIRGGQVLRTDSRAHRKYRPAPADRRPARGHKRLQALEAITRQQHGGYRRQGVARPRFGMTAASFQGDK